MSNVIKQLLKYKSIKSMDQLRPNRQAQTRGVSVLETFRGVPCRGHSAMSIDQVTV